MAEKENAYFWFRQNALVFIKDGEDVPDNVRGRLIKPEAANQVCRNLYKRKMRRAENEIKKLKKELAKYESGAKPPDRGGGCLPVAPSEKLTRQNGAH
jgi:hypothetical protein